MSNSKKIVYLLAAILVLAVGLGGYYLVRTKDDCLSLADNPATWTEVAQKWRQNKLILLLRHTTKCDGASEDCPTDNEYLTEEGREEAAIIGEGLKSLPGEFMAYHSPMSRTRDTASIAIGDASEPRAWLATACKTNFQDYFFALPLTNNYVLVTHSNCFDNFLTEEGEYLLGFDSGTRFHFGIAAFFEREVGADGSKEAKLLGCVWPEDWEELE